MLNAIIVYAYSFIVGAVIGSFLNVVIYRLPNGNFFGSSRSFCPNCKETIKAYDLIPIVSYLILGGKCRSCGAKISYRYPLVEAFTGLMAVLSVIIFLPGLTALLVFAVVAVLIAITMIDFDTMEIPNELVFALIPPALCCIFAFPEVSILSRVIGFFAVSLPLLVITLIIPSAFGGGDIKLIAVCGFLLGVQNVLLAFFIAVITGGAYAAYLMLTKQKSKGSHIAFGPYICLGVTVALFFGNEIVWWYLSMFGL